MATIHHWSITMGYFKPSFAVGSRIDTDVDEIMLSNMIIADHISRSTLTDRTWIDYQVEAFTDEFRVYVRSKSRDGLKARWRLLINLQYEGRDD